MAFLEVNSDTCTKCGACAAVCPGSIIYFKKNSYPRLMPGTELFCLRCGHCVAVCPSGSMEHDEMPLAQFPRVDSLLDITFKQCAQLIKNRRSVREFKDKKVPVKEIECIIDVARYAPTGHNNQEVQWLIINNRETVSRLAAIGTDWFRWSVKNNPALAPTLERHLRKQESGIDIFLRNAPTVVIAFAEKHSPIANIDCAIALGYFDVAAVSAGLGCCWAGFLQMAANTFPPMIEALALPEGYSVYGCLMVGYPRYKYQRVPVRKPARIIWRP